MRALRSAPYLDEAEELVGLPGDRDYGTTWRQWLEEQGRGCLRRIGWKV